MPNDIPDWTQATNITAGSVTIAGGSVSISGVPVVSLQAGATVAISGTPNVSITGIPTVNINAGQAVSISGTPSVSIASGSVAISGGTINVQTAAGVQVQTAQSQVLLATAVVAAGATASIGYTALPAGTHSIQATSKFALNPLDIFRINGNNSGNTYISLGGFPAGSVTAPIGSAADTQVSGMYANANGAGPNAYWISAILDTVATYPVAAQPEGAVLTNNAPPYVEMAGVISIEDGSKVRAVSGTRIVQNSGNTHLAMDVAEPQMASIVAVDTSVAAAGVSVLVAGVALNYIKLFDAMIGGPGAASIWLEDSVGTILGVFVQGGVGTHYPYHRYPLGQALGLRVHNTDAAARFIRGMVSYTQSQIAA